MKEDIDTFAFTSYGNSNRSSLWDRCLGIVDKYDEEKIYFDKYNGRFFTGDFLNPMAMVFENREGCKKIGGYFCCGSRLMVIYNGIQEICIQETILGSLMINHLNKMRYGKSYV